MFDMETIWAGPMFDPFTCAQTTKEIVNTSCFPPLSFLPKVKQKALLCAPHVQRARLLHANEPARKAPVLFSVADDKLHKDASVTRGRC